MENLFTISHKKSIVKVVVFSGGRGSSVISKQLINNSQIELTLAINGYDDGASTGEIRRFLGDSLGPSDFRKNASRLAHEFNSCKQGIIKLLDLRFPVNYSASEAIASFRIIKDTSVNPNSEFQSKLKTIALDIVESSRKLLTNKLLFFENELEKSKKTFSFSDCSIGNLIFAGCYLEKNRNFNAAIDDYCTLLGLPIGLIENVTDGTNSYLVAIDQDNRILGSEEEIVDASKRNYVEDIFLIDRPLKKDDEINLSSESLDNIKLFFEKRAKTVASNPVLLKRLAEADLIIYAPGTQHSSLFPSYMTTGLGIAIARNLKAIKLFITNIQEDAEIPDASALKIVKKAVYYMKEKGLQKIITPCLITHYLINDPFRRDAGKPYIPLGRLESLEDPRLVRIGNFEDGITGHHDASKILTPFIESFFKKKESNKLAILLLETESLSKISQTILEMFRGGIHNLHLSITVFYKSKESLDSTFTESLPFKVCNVYKSKEAIERPFLSVLNNREFDYIAFFESSGMYKGDDIVNIASLLRNERLDAVWGSRRLSVKDIQQSYKLRYRHNIFLGAISFLGSYFLSLIYLLLYGRYISDTLSGVRVIKASYLRKTSIDLKTKYVNQCILSILLRNKGDIIETPVQFFPISPEKVRRSTILDGIQSFLTIFWWRLKPKRHMSLNYGEAD